MKFKFFEWNDIECREEEGPVDAVMRNIRDMVMQGWCYKERKTKLPTDPVKLTVVSPNRRRWNIEDCIEELKGQWEFGNYRKAEALHALTMFNWLYYDFAGPNGDAIPVAFDPYKLGLLERN
jgi:hypothetical protein